MKILIIVLGLLTSMVSMGSNQSTLRIATFNVSMDATNYLQSGEKATGEELFERLATGQHPQIRNIAEIIQRVRPDIILLNEFDYTPDDAKGVQAFIQNYLNKPQQGAEAINYPYYYTAPVNTGVPSDVPLGPSGNAADTFGFGFYPGHYGMLLLSRYPLDEENIRTFQHFLWKDMPGGLMNDVKGSQGEAWYGLQAQAVFRLSSKSHWDIPVIMNGKTLHVLASHPTPPVFDGPEDRNGRRNHDEIRFWNDYITGGETAAYIYDDKGQTGGLNQSASAAFVIMGDQNASPVEGDAYQDGIIDLLNNPLVQNEPIPLSEGGKTHSPKNPNGAGHTAAWRMRADYVLPSVSGIKVYDSAVFWPEEGSEQHRLIQDRGSSSDHRLVWIDAELTQ